MVDIVPSNPRAQFRERLAAFAGQYPDLGAPELARRFAETLTEEDRELVEELLTLDAQTLLAEQFRVRFSLTRRAVFAALDVPNVQHRDAEPTALGRGRPRLPLYEQITAWREYVPGVGHRPVLEMTKAEVRSALEQRMGILMTTFWRTEVLRRLDLRLEYDAQRVGEVFSDEDIAGMISTVRKEMRRGNLRLPIRSVPSLSSAPAVPRQADGRGAKKPKAH